MIGDRLDRTRLADFLRRINSLRQGVFHIGIHRRHISSEYTFPDGYLIYAAGFADIVLKIMSRRRNHFCYRLMAGRTFIFVISVFGTRGVLMLHSGGRPAVTGSRNDIVFFSALALLTLILCISLFRAGRRYRLSFHPIVIAEFHFNTDIRAIVHRAVSIGCCSVRNIRITLIAVVITIQRRIWGVCVIVI